MWLGDRTWRDCPACSAWGWTQIISVSELLAANRIEVQCRHGHRWQHEPDELERLHLHRPEPPPEDPKITVHRGPSEHGARTFSAGVPAWEIAVKVIERWRREYPDDCCFICEGGSIVATAIPGREMAKPLSERIMPIPESRIIEPRIQARFESVHVVE